MKDGDNVVSIRREGVKKGVYILPNLCTTASLFCGFYAIIHSLQSDFVRAAWAIIIAGVFDFLDGRVARLTHAESEFGIEYDSLVDLSSFGLAPGVLMYTWGLSGFNKFGWLAAFMYFACGALRLARFNVQVDNVEKNWFQGLPIPLAAGVCTTMVIFYNYVDWATSDKNYVALVSTIVLSLLMVSTIPYRSFKQIHFRSRWSFFWLVVAVGLIFVIAAEPEISMFLVSISYVAIGIIEEIVTLRKSRQLIEKFKSWKSMGVENAEDEAV